MEVLNVILNGLTVLLTLFKVVYDILTDKKEAATDCNSDGCATK